MGELDPGGLGELGPGLAIWLRKQLPIAARPARPPLRSLAAEGGARGGGARASDLGRWKGRRISGSPLSSDPFLVVRLCKLLESVFSLCMTHFGFG